MKTSKSPHESGSPPSKNLIPSTAHRRKKSELVAFIGEGVECRGKIKNHGNVRINGRFEGEIYTKGSLLVGTRGIIEAKIRAGTIVSEGTITGEIIAKDKVKLLGSAVLNGSVETPELFKEKGVTLNTPWNIWMKKGKFSVKHLDPRTFQVVDAYGVDQQAFIDQSTPQT